MDKITLLYVDDEPINLMLFENIFSHKYNILTGESGNTGLKLLNEHPEINLIFSDMKMPFMTGIEFISEAKKIHPDKKYYIITGYNITEEIQTALKTQLILKYFSKPFNIEEIKRTIEESVL